MQTSKAWKEMRIIPQWGHGEEVRLIVSQQQNHLEARKVKKGGREGEKKRKGANVPTIRGSK